MLELIFISRYAFCLGSKWRLGDLMGIWRPRIDETELFTFTGSSRSGKSSFVDYAVDHYTQQLYRLAEENDVSQEDIGGIPIAIHCDLSNLDKLSNNKLLSWNTFDETFNNQDEMLEYYLQNEDRELVKSHIEKASTRVAADVEDLIALLLDGKIGEERLNILRDCKIVHGGAPNQVPSKIFVEWVGAHLLKNVCKNSREIFGFMPDFNALEKNFQTILNQTNNTDSEIRKTETVDDIRKRHRVLWPMILKSDLKINKKVNNFTEAFRKSVIIDCDNASNRIA